MGKVIDLKAEKAKRKRVAKAPAKPKSTALVVIDQPDPAEIVRRPRGRGGRPRR